MTAGKLVTGTAHNGVNRVWSGTDGKYVTINGKRLRKFNAYTLTQLSVNETPDTVYGLYYTQGGAYQPVFTNDDTIKLNNKLLDKIRGHSFNLGVFVAEGPKTVQLVKDTILTVGHALVDVKHGKFLRASQRLGVSHTPSKLHPSDVAGRWLELQYGWLPLISDCHEAVKAFESLTRSPDITTVRVGTQRIVNYDSSTSPTNWSCPTTALLRQNLQYVMTRSESFTQALGLEDPATIAWELLPYSFVVDWFLPIGPFLSAATAIPKLTGRWCKSQIARHTCGNSVVKNKTFYKGCTHRHENVYVTRTVGTGNLNTPLPNFKSIPEAMSPLHIANAIALVTSLLATKK